MRAVVQRTSMLLLIACTALAAGLAGSAAAAVAPGDGVGAVVTPAGNEDVFWLDSSGIEEMSHSVTGWSAAAPIPGSATVAASAPAAAVYQGTEDIFYLGTDGGIWEQQQTGGAWQAPEEIRGTNGVAASAPTVDVFRAGDEEDVFWRGNDGGLWQTYFAHGQMSPAGEFPGSAGWMASAPTAIVTGADGSQLNLFWRSADGGIDDYYLNGSWTGPTEIAGTSGQLTSAPTAISYAPAGPVNVFWRAPDGGLGQLQGPDGVSGWRGPSEVGGSAGALGTGLGATVVTGGSSQLDLFGLDPAGALQAFSYTPAAGWTRSMPAPAPTTSTTTTSPTPTPTGNAPTTVTPPASPKGSRKRIHVKLTMYWRWTARGTRLRRAEVGRLPRGARITVTCSGGGCPTAALSVGPRGVAGLWHALEQHRFRPEAKLRITFAKRGYRSERILVTFARHAKPTMRLT